MRIVLGGKCPGRSCMCEFSLVEFVWIVDCPDGIYLVRVVRWKLSGRSCQVEVVREEAVHEPYLVSFSHELKKIMN